MKHFSTLLAGTLFMVTAQAQITVTTNDMPAAGDSVRVSFAAGIGNTDVTLTGPNYLWDYSFLTPNAQQRIEFNPPTAIPFNFLATVATTNPSPDSIPFLGAIPTDFYDYFKASAGSYKQVGSSFTYAPLGNLTIPILYTSSDVVYRFPLDYGNIDSSDAHYSFSIPNLIYYGEDRHRVNVVDGWGTLMTPFGTFNTLRMRSIVDAVDTISMDTFGLHVSTPLPTEIQYKWMGIGSKIPLLEVDVQLIATQPVVTNVIYQDSLRDSLFQVGVAEQTAQEIKSTLFPNPTDNSSLLIYQLDAPANVSISLADLQGREVLSRDLGRKASGIQQEQLDLTTLAPGVYFVRLQAGAQHSVQRLVVQ